MSTLPAFCIHRPIATLLLCLGLIAAGVIAYLKLPIAALPRYDTPIISVSAALPGASPETMASSVATPLEKQFALIPGLVAMSSSSTSGSTSVTLEFAQDRDIDAAAVDVQAALLRAQRSFPQDMTQPPAYRKVNPADSPVLIMALTSPALSLTQLNEYAETLVSPALSTLSGVAQVTVFGQKRYAVRIAVDPDRLRARELTLAEVSAAVRAANDNAPVGLLEGPRQVLTIQANRQLPNAAAFAELVIASRQGMPVRLGEVAEVHDSVENVRGGSWVNGARAIQLAVYRQPDANTVAVVDAVRAELPRFQAQLPGSVEIRLLNDRSRSVREAIGDVQFTLALTLALVVMVIFLFLRRLSATLIPALALPVSLLGVFPLMLALGYSLDNISLLGLTLAVGLVVDDAIVMLENIVRHVEAGTAPARAALLGSREVAFTIVSITVSLVAVFIPIFFMPGAIGLLFHEFAVTVSLALLLSALVALTLIPMLCSRYLKPADRHGGHGGNAWVQHTERGLERIVAAYLASLRWTLRHGGWMLALTLATVVASAWMYARIPKGFFPEEDIGQIFIQTEAAADISYPAMAALQNRAAALVLADAGVATVSSSLGGANVYQGRMFVNLKPRDQREPMPVVVARLRARLGEIVGLSAYPNPVQNLRLGGRQTKSRYQYVLQGVDGAALERVAAQLMAGMGRDPAFADATSDAQNRGLDVRVEIGRDKAATLGVEVQAIRETLYAAFGQRQVSTIYAASDSYDVILELAERFREDESAFDKIFLRGADGALVPLATLASARREIGPTQVNHEGQLRAITLSFNLAPGYALGDATARLKAIEVAIGLPPSVTTRWGGDAGAFAQTQTGQVVLLLAAVLVIYVVLGVLYESFIHPLTILAGLPSAAVGALATLELFGLELSLIATIGILMLIGIVKKNAIMMVDFALEAQRTGQPAQHAILEAARLRLRPITMTTLAALMGALPIALGLGASAELRQPLGLAVCGGLLFSQMVTLYITPTIYLYLERLNAWVNRRGRFEPLGEHG